MAYENLCMYCFEELNGKAVCPHCGRDANAAVPQIQLLPGSLVYHDRFLIGRALGQDAGGIVYAALDTKKDNALRIREYLPRDCAERLSDGNVVPIAGLEDRFEAGLQKLRASVEEEPDPQKRHFFFEENGTAYIVQRKSKGQSDAGHSAFGEDADDGRRGNMIIIGLVAAIAVIAAAIVLILVFNGTVDRPKDVTENPTLDPNQTWVPVETPTVTPYVSPTFAALVDPELTWMDFTLTTASPSSTSAPRQTAQSIATPTPTSVPTPVPTVSGSASSYGTITSKSGSADIRALQQRLAALGWLSASGVTGQFDSATRQAVRDFQSYVNQNCNPQPALTVDGLAGPKTQQWLYQVSIARPTPTPRVTATPRVTVAPTPVVTATDETVIDENSSANKIRAMQRELILLGVMPEGSDNATFDAVTRAAVRRFQNRVNQLQGYQVLEPTGRMDALSAAFLDYYVDEWRKLQTATATPAPVVTPTPTAAPAATEAVDLDSDPNPVNAASSQAAVRNVQRRLIAIGMLPTGSDTGVYNSATAQAVASFQQWVNSMRNEQTLTISGEADSLTRAYLKYCQDNGLRPYGQNVSIPTAAPTEEPDERVDITIDKNSDRDSIRRVQQMLVDVGLLSGNIDGIYGNGTTQAVRAFQEWVNAQGGALTVSGIVDNATREALEYYSDRGIAVNSPTPTPTAEPEDAPYVPDDNVGENVSISIGPDSDPDSIRFVQHMLYQIGALSESNINGAYDAATVQAVRTFQSWFSAQGMQALDITGQVDNTTRQMLEYCSDHDLRMNVESATPEPAQAPVGEAGDVEIFVGDTLSDGGIVEIYGTSCVVRWQASGAVQGYHVYVTDSAGNALVSRENVQNTEFSADASRMQPGEVYTVTVGAIPTSGIESQITWRSARFMVPAGGAAAQPPMPEATAEPTVEPLPTVGAVTQPRITIGGTSASGDIAIVEQGSFQITWDAGSGAQSYNVQITDEYGNVMLSQANAAQTAMTVPGDRMTPGVVYTITVGAIPQYGSETDIAWSQASFMMPVAATPTPTPEPTAIPTPEPTPAPTVASIGRPFVTIGGAAYQRDGVSYMTDNTIIISWGAEGAVSKYIVYVESQSGERQNLSDGADTSRTLSASALPSGMYTVYVGAVPAGGSQEDAEWNSTQFGIPEPTPEPTEAPTEAPATPDPVYTWQYSGAIDGSSDAGTVQSLQRRLYMLGVMSGEPEQGVLDQITLQAVAEFQRRANSEHDAGLNVIDPSDLSTVIDTKTLSWIAQGL